MSPRTERHAAIFARAARQKREIRAAADFTVTETPR